MTTANAPRAKKPEIRSREPSSSRATTAAAPVVSVGAAGVAGVAVEGADGQQVDQAPAKGREEDIVDQGPGGGTGRQRPCRKDSHDSEKEAGQRARAGGVSKVSGRFTTSIRVGWSLIATFARLASQHKG